jgi:hypothetical protein
MLLLGLTFDSLKSSIDHIRFENLVPAVGHAGTPILDSVKIASSAPRFVPKVYRAIFDPESVQAAMYTAGERPDTVDQTGEKCSNKVRCGNDL